LQECTSIPEHHFNDVLKFPGHKTSFSPTGDIYCTVQYSISGETVVKLFQNPIADFVSNYCKRYSNLLNRDLKSLRQFAVVNTTHHVGRGLVLVCHRSEVSAWRIVETTGIMGGNGTGKLLWWWSDIILVTLSPIESVMIIM